MYGFKCLILEKERENDKLMNSIINLYLPCMKLDQHKLKKVVYEYIYRIKRNVG